MYWTSCWARRIVRSRAPLCCKDLAFDALEAGALTRKFRRLTGVLSL